MCAFVLQSTDEHSDESGSAGVLHRSVKRECCTYEKYFYLRSDHDAIHFVVAGECVDPLVTGLYASSFWASSRYNFLYSANFAKLYGEFVIITSFCWVQFFYTTTSVVTIPSFCSFSLRQQWLVPFPQRQTAMAAGQSGQEVPTGGHRNPGDF